MKLTGANKSLMHLSNSGLPFNSFNLDSVYIHLEGNPGSYKSANPYLLKNATSLGPERYSVSSLISARNFSIVF